jgi:hypothetical protein
MSRLDGAEIELAELRLENDELLMALANLMANVVDNVPEDCMSSDFEAAIAAAEELLKDMDNIDYE